MKYIAYKLKECYNDINKENKGDVKNMELLNGNIQLDIDYFKCYSFDDSKLSNDEKILARKFLAQFKNKLEKLGGN